MEWNGFNVLTAMVHLLPNIVLESWKIGKIGYAARTALYS